MTPMPASPLSRPGSSLAPLGVGRAHGKVILIGEHAVVYGAPAIVLPVTSLSVTARLEPADGDARIVSALYEGAVVDAPTRLAPTVAAWRAACERFGSTTSGMSLVVESDLPPERGLGSSAAVAAAVVRATREAAGAPADAAVEHGLIQLAESVAHGNPSGVDARAVASTTPLRFERGRAREVTVASRFALVIADSGVRGRTADAVAAVRDLNERHPYTVAATVDALAGLAEEAADDLAHGDVHALGSRMRRAHELLSQLGASDPALDALVSTAHAAGSPGAKLTGGGRGGCVLALAPSPAGAGDLARALAAAGASRVWTTTVEATA